MRFQSREENKCVIYWVAGIKNLVVKLNLYNRLLIDEEIGINNLLKVILKLSGKNCDSNLSPCSFHHFTQQRSINQSNQGQKWSAKNVYDKNAVLCQIISNLGGIFSYSDLKFRL